MCGKKVVKYILFRITLKKDFVGVFYNRKERDQDNETGLKEERGIEMSTTKSFFIYAIARLS